MNNDDNNPSSGLIDTIDSLFSLPPPNSYSTSGLSNQDAADDSEQPSLHNHHFATNPLFSCIESSNLDDENLIAPSTNLDVKSSDSNCILLDESDSEDQPTRTEADSATTGEEIKKRSDKIYQGLIDDVVFGLILQMHRALKLDYMAYIEPDTVAATYGAREESEIEKHYQIYNDSDVLGVFSNLNENYKATSKK